MDGTIFHHLEQGSVDFGPDTMNSVLSVNRSCAQFWRQKLSLYEAESYFGAREGRHGSSLLAGGTQWLGMVQGGL